MNHQLYYSSRCVNCSRFIGALSRLEISRHVRVIDIDTMPVQGVEYVPTLVDKSGAMHVGTEAFKWLGQYEADAPLDTIPLMGCNGLAFSGIDSEGHAEFHDGYSAFEPVE